MEQQNAPAQFSGPAGKASRHLATLPGSSGVPSCSMVAKLGGYSIDWNGIYGGFHKSEYPKMVGLFHGESHTKMNDDWGNPHDLGNLHMGLSPKIGGDLIINFRHRNVDQFWATVYSIFPDRLI